MEEWSALRLVGDKTTTYFCTQVEQVHRHLSRGVLPPHLRDGRDVLVSDAFCCSARWRP